MKPRSQRPQDEGPFGWQSRAMAARAGQLGIQQHSVYCALSHFESAAAHDHKRRFAASYGQLAEHLNCSTKTIQRCLAELQKAELIFVFSGANGSRKNMRNCFFLVSFYRDSQSQRWDSQSLLPKDCESQPPKDYKSHLNKKENNYTAPPQAAAGVVEKEETETACTRLRRGSVSKNEEAEITDLAVLARARRMLESLD